MTTFREKRRARRIAADEAHAWARNLRLRNPLAKLVLCMLTQYVNGDGFCFVGIDELGKDCELAPNTIRSRLTWLEEMGVIARRPQWLDEKGRRNADGHGKRTTDDIRLLIETDSELIDQRIAGENPAESAEISPARGEGLNAGPDVTSPAPALQQPFTCVQGLISEPEPESSPKPPSRGLADVDWIGKGEEGKEAEPEHFEAAWLGYPGHEVMRRDLGLEAFRELTLDQQKRCRAAVPHYAAKLRELKQRRAMNFHLWVRSSGFDEFPNATLADEAPPRPSRRFIQGDELDGLKLASLIGERRDLPVLREQSLGDGVWRLIPFQHDLVALAGCGPPRDDWPVVELGSREFGAWRDRLQLWLGAEPRPEKIWLEPHDPAVHGLPTLHRDFRLRKSKQGFRVPRLWPPRRDGSWASPASGEKA
jgi:helix-turn-helix protein